MNLDEAVDLVAFAFEHAEPGDLFIQKADASTIGDLADGVMKVFGKQKRRLLAPDMVKNYTKHCLQTRNVQRLLTLVIFTVYLLIIAVLIMINTLATAMKNAMHFLSLTPITQGF